MRAWDIRDGEPEDAFKAFDVWVRLSKKRPITAEFAEFLEKKLDRPFSVHTLRNWMTDYEWRSRRKAYIQWRTKEKNEREAESIARESSLIAKQHTRVRRLSMRKAVSTLTKLKSIEPADAKDCDVIFTATLKAMQIAGIGMLDHADQLRRISAESGSEMAQQPAEAEEVIPPISDESGSVQYGYSEAETVLGTPEGDLSCDR